MSCPRCGKKAVIRPSGSSSRPGSNPTVANPAPRRPANSTRETITGLRYVPNK